LAEIFIRRGIIFTHEAVRDWESKFAPLLSETLRKKRRGVVSASWYVDETYVRVQGRWCYLYRAIDRDGNLVDVRLSATRDLAAAEAFLRSAWTVTGVTPDRITTDGHDASPRAIRNVFGERVIHRVNRYVNNPLEQDHRGITPRYLRHLQAATRPVRLPRHNDFREGRLTSGSTRGLACHKPEPPRARLHARPTTNSEVSHASL
jgi:putative transposase